MMFLLRRESWTESKGLISELKLRRDWWVSSAQRAGMWAGMYLPPRLAVLYRFWIWRFFWRSMRALRRSEETLMRASMESSFLNCRLGLSCQILRRPPTATSRSAFSLRLSLADFLGGMGGRGSVRGGM